jgi:HD-GYP domain-containing protein (c-di-GMP phosphodiesterase class II)
MAINDAIEELNRCKNTQFDPDVVDAFIEVLKEEDSLDKE